MAGQMESPPPYTQYNNPKSFEGGQPGPSFPPQQQQHQHQPQQQVVIVQPQVAPTYIYRPHPVSMTGAIVLSCFVFWCFGWLFGAIAFILAIIGSDSSQNGDITSALRLRNASYGVSVAGIVIGIIVIIAVIIVFVNHKPNCYTVNGMQYCG